MDQKYSVNLSTLVNEFELNVAYKPPHYEEVRVVTPDLNRPGMQLIGFFSHFDNDRLQIMGIVETMYLKTLPSVERRKCFEMLLKRDIPALIICHGMEVYPECMEMAQKYGVTLLTTEIETSVFEAELIATLNVYLGPRIMRHGVMMEVYGEGILLTGESGVGKSETAIELVKRGHRLIADDAVEIKKISYNTLFASAPDLIRHYIELRGIGVVDVMRLFGMGAVKSYEQLSLIINIEPWEDGKMYDRLGLENNYSTLLGVKIPTISVPIKPGRNLAVIVEVAAMNNRQKKMGFNSAQEFTDRINKHFEQSMSAGRKDGAAEQ
ncbi:MAG: HPr(Ser) kinase/phosphatase [Oscillospiraceae bacterium]|jgi:HPr kinase/phosphorylase|nr:HPr(Ser) kinase/phosphatase [Oscillospiraceae bacterium]